MQIRFAKKVKAELTFQFRHRLLIWRLKSQKVKAAAGSRQPLSAPPRCTFMKPRFS